MPWHNNTSLNWLWSLHKGLGQGAAAETFPLWVPRNATFRAPKPILNHPHCSLTFLPPAASSHKQLFHEHTMQGEASCITSERKPLGNICLSMFSLLHTNFYINKLRGSWAASLANPPLILFSFEIKFCFQVQDELIFSSCTQLPAASWPFSSAASFLWEFPLLKLLRASQHACLIPLLFYLNFHKFKTRKKKKSKIIICLASPYDEEREFCFGFVFLVSPGAETGISKGDFQQPSSESPLCLCGFQHTYLISLCFYC